MEALFSEVTGLDILLYLKGTSENFYEPSFQLSQC